MNHAVHHLTNTEAVPEVVERVVAVVLLDCQLGDREIFIQYTETNLT